MSFFDKYIHQSVEYEITRTNDVYSVLKKDFKTRLIPFLKKHLEIQKAENYPFLTQEQVLKFPYTNSKSLKNEEFSRRQDLEILKELIKPYSNNGKLLLEIGGWNGWLTNKMQAQNISVISADIFEDEHNGLGSKKKHENSNWLSLQTDIEDISIYKTKFDVIIFNHALHFYSQPETLINSYKSLLNDNGMFLILGVDVITDSTKKEKEIEKYRKHYQDKYNFNLAFYESKGFFEMALFNSLLRNKFKFIRYKLSPLGRMKNYFYSKKCGILVYKS